MKAVCVEYSATTATVRMVPGLLSRLCGARTTEIMLGRARKPGSDPGTIFFTPWVAFGSGRDLDEIEHGDLIRDAIDFREVAALPIAIARTT